MYKNYKILNDLEIFILDNIHIAIILLPTNIEKR